MEFDCKYRSVASVCLLSHLFSRNLPPSLFLKKSDVELVTLDFEFTCTLPKGYYNRGF